MIALNVIVKNDAEELEHLLEHISDYVDEIVTVIDSDTKDNSEEIARKYRSKVIIADWDNSFSKLKNICMEYSDSDWILSLGTDERLNKKLLDNLEFLIIDPRYDFYSLTVIHKKEKTREYQIRLFKRSKAKFILRVHEFLDILNKDKICILPDEYYIVHLQNPRSKHYQNEKNKRYKKLLNLIRKESGLILYKKLF